MCSQCGRKFAKQSQLNEHQSQCSSDDPTKDSSKDPFQCDLCNQTFPTEFYLNKHTLIFHRIKKFECKFCHARFKIEKFHRAHEDKCDGNVSIARGMYNCRECRQQFETQIDLRRHQVKLHGQADKYQCSECKKIYRSTGKMQFYEYKDILVKEYFFTSVL